ncbi:Uncharacterised protein [Bordetella pertussis]|nr:Uncharacterised protein [Bordetella pertussis]
MAWLVAARAVAWSRLRCSNALCQVLEFGNS